MPTVAGVAQQSEEGEFRADEGPLGLLQTDLRRLIYKLLELSIMASETTDDTHPQPRLASKIDIISQLGDLDALRNVLDQRIPLDVLRDIDSLSNPLLITKERIERAAAENQRMSGRLNAIASYRAALQPLLSTTRP